MSAPWTWDPSRQDFYTYDPQDKVYIYQHGSKLDEYGRTLDPPPGLASYAGRKPASTIAIPRTNPPASSDFSSTMLAGIGSQYESLASQQESSTTLAATTPQEQPINSQAAVARLDSSFTLVRPEKFRSYFKRGRIFKTLWPEPAANREPTADNSITKDAKFGESIFNEIRWFLVVQSFHGHCICVPVHTYGKRGTAKRDALTPNHVSLIIRGYRESEDYNSGGYDSDAPLEMIVENDNIKLEPSSRIDFSKFYTVEYNIKVFTVGRIAPEDIERILRYARQALTKKPEARRYVARTIDNRTGRLEYIDVIEDSGSDVNWISQDIAAKLEVNTRATGSDKEYVSYTGARFVPRSKSKITLGSVRKSIYDEFFIAPDDLPFSGIIVGRTFLNTWGHLYDLFPEKKETGPTNLDQEFADDWQIVPLVSGAEGPQRSTGSQAFPQQTQLTNLDEAIRQRKVPLWKLEEESVRKQSELDAQIHLQEDRLSQLQKETADAERTLQQLQQQQQGNEELQATI